jgi:hypothetical protein
MANQWQTDEVSPEIIPLKVLTGPLPTYEALFNTKIGTHAKCLQEFGLMHFVCDAPFTLYTHLAISFRTPHSCPPSFLHDSVWAMVP